MFLKLLFPLFTMFCVFTENVRLQTICFTSFNQEIFGQLLDDREIPGTRIINCQVGEKEKKPERHGHFRKNARVDGCRIQASWKSSFHNL